MSLQLFFISFSLSGYDIIIVFSIEYKTVSITLLILGIVPIICLIVLNTKIYYYITGLKNALQCKEGRFEKEIDHRNEDKLALAPEDAQYEIVGLTGCKNYYILKQCKTFNNTFVCCQKKF